MRDYIIEASPAGYLVWLVDGKQKYPLGDQPYPSLSRARDQIPKRFRAKARLIHHTAYTEMINGPEGVSPPLDLSIR